MTREIAEVTTPEADEVVDLWQRCGLTRPWNDPRADLDRAMGATDATVLVLREESLLVGTVMVGHDGHRGWVYYLATHPDRRHQGIGRLLMEAAESWAVGRGVPKLQLMVRTTNAEARGFYDRLGYEQQDVVVLGRWL